MSADLLFEYEQEFIDCLDSAGIGLCNAYAAVLMYFREWTRPASEMPAILSRYSTKLSLAQAESSFRWLLSQGLLLPDRLSGTDIYRIASNYGELLQSLTGLPDLAKQLAIKKKLRDLSHTTRTKVVLKPLGAVSDEGNYQTMLTRLSAAQHSIKTSVCSAHIYEETARVFEEQAHQGVKIQILVCSKELLSRYRGATTQEAPVIRWRQRFKGMKNIEIREYTEPAPIEMASCYLIDDSTLRMIVYDYHATPPLDGYLLEAINRQDQHLNLIDWFQRRFNESWDKAKYNNIPPMLRILISPFSLNLVLSALLVFLFARYEMEDIVNEVILLALGASLSYLCKQCYTFLRSLSGRFARNINHI